MTWHDLSGYSTFEKARRRELARRLARLVLGKPSDRLLALDEVREQLGLYEQWYVGIRSIPVAKIVGSVDRAADFDRTFLPKRGNMEGRWKRVEQAFRIEAFPPIVAFKVGDAYFIEDGHHRVAIARQRKDEFIDGDVTEVKSPVSITADTDVAEIVHMGLRQWFLRESQLDQVRPDAHVEPSRPHAYAELLEIIFAAGFELAMAREEVIRPAVAAAHWYDHLYAPSVERIRAGNLPTIFPRATAADLYLRVHEQHRELVSRTPAHGIDDAVNSAESAAADTITGKARLALGDAKEKITSTTRDGAKK
jgi:hypothetical protein